MENQVKVNRFQSALEFLEISTCLLLPVFATRAEAQQDRNQQFGLSERLTIDERLRDYRSESDRS